VFDLLRNHIFGALCFSPKFLITCQIVILVRFKMIQTSTFGADSFILLVFEIVLVCFIEFFRLFPYLRNSKHAILKCSLLTTHGVLQDNLCTNRLKVIRHYILYKSQS